MTQGLNLRPSEQSDIVALTPDGLRRIRRWGVGITVGSFLFGFDTGIISGALLFLRRDLQLDSFEQSSVVSVLLFGAVAGALASGRISDRIGRRAILGALAVPAGGARTRIASLRSQAPLALRPTIASGRAPWSDRAGGAVHVRLAAGAGGPVGGDRLALRVDVGAQSTLVLRDVSATLLLPGPHGEPSRLEADVHVGAGATLVWLPEPVIAVRGCHHAADMRIALGPGARLLLREELLLGRHGEPPGDVRLHVRLRLDGRPLLDQDLVLGPEAPASDGPAVTGGHRAIGSLLMVDPAWSEGPPAAVPLEGDAAVMPLCGPAALVSALCADGLRLRRSLDEGLALLERALAAGEAQTSSSSRATPAEAIPFAPRSASSVGRSAPAIQ